MHDRWFSILVTDGGGKGVGSGRVVGSERRGSSSTRVCSIEPTESSVKFLAVNVSGHPLNPSGWIRPLIAKKQSIHSESPVINSLSNDALCPTIISARLSRYFTFVTTNTVKELPALASRCVFEPVYYSSFIYTDITFPIFSNLPFVFSNPVQCVEVFLHSFLCRRSYHVQCRPDNVTVTNSPSS